jgi:hypothetical protein
VIGDLAAHYTTSVRKHLRTLAAWPPDRIVRIGDVGTLDRDRFQHWTTLRAIGIPAGGVREIEQPGFEHLTIAGDVTVEFDTGAGSDAALEVVASARGSAEVSFLKEGAILLDMGPRRTTFVEDLQALKRRIVARWEQNRWEPEWCVVVEVTVTDATTVAISNVEGASLHLTAAAEIAPGPALSLANASLGLMADSNSGVDYSMIAEEGATPLFRALRLKERFWTATPKVSLEGVATAAADDSFVDPETRKPLFELLDQDQVARTP